MNRNTKFILTVSTLTTFLTWFFYAHETLPKPLRAATALLETPVALVSGLSYYLNLGVDVYETLWAIVLSNLLFSIFVVVIINKFLIKKKNS
ncbi:MAG: hypothetical protein ACKVQV_04850 [Bacteroidia bacterium]